MKKANLFANTLFAASMLASNSAFAVDVDRASMLANTCAGCHGPNGKSLGPATPSIAGTSKEYFIQTMNDFKSGDRPSTIMMRIAKGYSDEDIALMADYFSKIK